MSYGVESNGIYVLTVNGSGAINVVTGINSIAVPTPST